jgi:hypothetical protein
MMSFGMQQCWKHGKAAQKASGHDLTPRPAVEVVWFIWKLTNDSLEFFAWIGPCTPEDSSPGVLVLDKDELQQEWHPRLSFQKVNNVTDLKIVWVNCIAPSNQSRKPIFISPPFTSINPSNRCMQMSVIGPCAIWLPQPLWC